MEHNFVVFVAQFDDYKGKVIRTHYPPKEQVRGLEDIKEGGRTQSIEDRLAELIIPDSGNDRMTDTSFFVLNRPPVKQIQQNVRELEKSR
mmetsp:Transcript_26373/g.40267  ORF Transcript_26373/g.40267 Transcript_26373/m.40267 type:complete len:90 (-) Transcript_26373:261-530(-)